MKSAAPWPAGRVAATMMGFDGVASWTPEGSRRSDHTARSPRVYTDMQLWTEIRRRVLAEKLSKRQACRDYGLHWHTLAKILSHSEPPGYRQTQPRPKRKLARFLPIIHEILKQDQHAPTSNATPPDASATACGGRVAVGRQHPVTQTQPTLSVAQTRNSPLGHSLREARHGCTVGEESS